MGAELKKVIINLFFSFVLKLGALICVPMFWPNTEKSVMISAILLLLGYLVFEIFNEWLKLIQALQYFGMGVVCGTGAYALAYLVMGISVTNHYDNILSISLLLSVAVFCRPYVTTCKLTKAFHLILRGNVKFWRSDKPKRYALLYEMVTAWVTHLVLICYTGYYSIYFYRKFQPFAFSFEGIAYGLILSDIIALPILIFMEKYVRSDFRIKESTLQEKFSYMIL